MIIELNKLNDDDLKALLESSLAHERRCGYILVASSSDRPLMYVSRNAAGGLKEFGGNEQPDIYATLDEPARTVREFRRSAPPALRMQYELRTVLWINPAVNLNTIAIVLGRTHAPSAVGEIIFEATGSDKLASDAEAAAQRSAAEKRRLEENERQRRRQQHRGRNRTRSGRRTPFW